MLCPKCGTYAAPEDIVCPKCDAPMDHAAYEEEGLRSLRQGKRAREMKAAGASVKPEPKHRAGQGASRAYAAYVDQSTAEIPIYGEDNLMRAPGVSGDTFSRYRRTRQEAEGRGQNARHVQHQNEYLH